MKMDTWNCSTVPIMIRREKIHQKLGQNFEWRRINTTEYDRHCKIPSRHSCCPQSQTTAVLVVVALFLSLCPVSVTSQDVVNTAGVDNWNQSSPATPSQVPTDLTLNDVNTTLQGTDLPSYEMEYIFNVTYFETVILQYFANEYGINMSDPEQECMLRDITKDMVDFSNDGGVPYCPHHWDQLFCWETSPPGPVYRPCVSYQGVEYTGNVSRICYPNGTWGNNGKSDFECEPTKEVTEDNIHFFLQHKVLLNIGYGLSMISLIGAFLIFLFFKSLRCVRNNIHWNLITSFILLYVFFYMAMLANHLAVEYPHLSWLCRTVMCLINNAVLTNFFWMLIEGVYLHLLVVRAMTVRRERFWIYMVIGWCCPMVFTTGFIMWRIIQPAPDEVGAACWNNMMPSDYLIYVPIIIVVVVNIFILIHVITILVSKLRASNSFETQQYWKSVRATFILLPLLGGAYFFFMYSPPDDSQFKITYGYLQVIAQSVQGLFVAVFYVYMNQEVVNLLKRKYRRWQESHSIQVNRRSSLTFHSTLPYSLRKGSTDSTNVSKFRIYTPEKVPPFVPGEVVPLQCKMDYTPTLGAGIQEWAKERGNGGVRSDVYDNEVHLRAPGRNGVTMSNGKKPGLTARNGNNNDNETMTIPSGAPDFSGLGKSFNNHNDASFNEGDASSSFPEAENNVFPEEEQKGRVPASGYPEDASLKKPLLDHRNRQLTSTSSSCPLLEVDNTERLSDNHAKWSPKLLLKKFSPHTSPQTHKHARPTTIPEVHVDSIQFPETPCGTPV